MASVPVRGATRKRKANAVCGFERLEDEERWVIAIRVIAVQKTSQ